MGKIVDLKNNNSLIEPGSVSMPASSIAAAPDSASKKHSISEENFPLLKRRNMNGLDYSQRKSPGLKTTTASLKSFLSPPSHVEDEEISSHSLGFPQASSSRDSSVVATIGKPCRQFLPKNLEINSWGDVEHFFKNLERRRIFSERDLVRWLRDRSELDAAISEAAAWKFIHMSCNTGNANFSAAVNYFSEKVIQPAAECSHNLNEIFINKKDLVNKLKPAYAMHLLRIERAREAYRHENTLIEEEIKSIAMEYKKISGSMMVKWGDEFITIQAAEKILGSLERSTREKIFHEIQSPKKEGEIFISGVFRRLVSKRHQQAKNANYKNYRDYIFKIYNRVYTPEECARLRDGIAEEVLPLVKSINNRRREKLKLGRLKLWDMNVDVDGKPPLSPGDTAENIFNKGIACLSEIMPSFGDILNTIKAMKRFDVESREGKSPGSFSYPLLESGGSFFYGNYTGTHYDVSEFFHETGHAIHSSVTHGLESTMFKNSLSAEQTPQEVAELFALVMEFIGMEHYDKFYSDPIDVLRAKSQQIERVLEFLLWIAAIDGFQHEVYTNPQFTDEDVMKAWEKIIAKFSDNNIDRTGLEGVKRREWQKQPHVFSDPFYYIEYAMAQLGAIAVWRNYKNDPKNTLAKYQEALRLGYTKPIHEIYETAGAKFDMSSEYVSELVGFVGLEWNKIQQELALLKHTM